MTVSSSYWVYFRMLLWMCCGEQFRAAAVRGLAKSSPVTGGPPTAALWPQQGHRYFFLCFTADIPLPSLKMADFWRDGSGGGERTMGLWSLVFENNME